MTERGNRLEFLLSKVKSIKGDRVIWGILACFAMISLLVVYSSTGSLAYRQSVSPFSFLSKQLLFFVIGFGVVLVCYKIPLRYYRNFAEIIFGITMVAMVIPIAMGQLRSFEIGGIDIQPSEMAKIATVIYLAKALESYNLSTFKNYLLKIVLPIGVLLALCLFGSVSVTLIIGLITALILCFSNITRKFLLYTIPIALAALIAIYVVHKTTGKFSRIATFEARIERFFSNDQKDLDKTPEEIAKDKEKQEQEKHAREAVQLGKFTGRGPGNSFKKDVLPNAYDDYIYSVIVEEYGSLGGAIVILLYVWFFIRCIFIAQNCKKEFSAVVVLGLGMLIVTQAFLHILVNVGLIPVTGQTLPMISKGGSSLIIMSSAFGIILSVNRTIEVSKAKEQK